MQCYFVDVSDIGHIINGNLLNIDYVSLIE